MSLYLSNIGYQSLIFRVYFPSGASSKTKLIVVIGNMKSRIFGKSHKILTETGMFLSEATNTIGNHLRV